VRSDSVLKGYLVLTSAGNLELYDSTGTKCGNTGSTVISANTKYRIEGKIPTGTSAAAEIKVNGVSEITGTCNFLTNNFGGIAPGKWTNRNGNTVDYFYDDIAIDDTTYPGDGSVVWLVPTSDGTTMQWLGGTNASNYLEVDERPFDTDTTYIAKSTATSEVALFNVADAATAGVTGTIKAIKTYSRFRSSIGTAATSVRASSNNTTSDTTAYAVGTGYISHFKLLATDPNTGLAWTTGGIDALQVGVIDTATISTVRATTVGAFVDYTVPTSSNRTLSTLGAGK